MKNTKLKSMILGLAMLVTSVTPALAGSNTINGNNITNVIGKDRVATSQMAANYLSGKTLVVTNGYSFPDALSAMNVLNKVDGKFILVDDYTDVYNYYKASGFDKIYVVGGRVHQRVMDNLKKLTPNVTVFDGYDRYETNEMTLKHFGYDTVGVADGRNYPDALAAAPLLKQKGYGLKLVNGAKPYTEVRTVAYTFGETVKQSGGMRLAGQDRYKTNIAINSQLKGINTALLVSGRNYPDALAAANLIKAVPNMSIALVSYKNEDMKAHLKDVPYFYRLGGIVTDDILKSVLPYRDVNNKNIPEPKTDDKKVEDKKDDKKVDPNKDKKVEDKKTDPKKDDKKPVPTPAIKKNLVYRIKNTSGMSTKDINDIKAVLPINITGFDTSKTLPSHEPSAYRIDVDGGKWVYKSYTKSESSSEIVYEYTWEFVKNEVPVPQPARKDIKVTIRAQEYMAAGGKIVPTEVTSQFNQNMIVKEGDWVTVPDPEKKVVKTEKGTWTFKRWVVNPQKAMLDRNGEFEFTSEWEFEYEWNKNLSEERISEIREQFNGYVNQYRIANSANPLTIDQSLLSAVNIRAKEIAVKFDHTRPDGSDFNTAINNTTSNYSRCAENIIKTPYEYYEAISVDEIAKQLAKLWYESYGHRVNMTNNNYTKHNIGIYQDSDKNLYAVDIFTN
jgi:uncharacterized protein YkwD/putative cell wall-binding protein